MPTQPGYKIWENATPAVVGSPAFLTGWFDTTGYTTLQVNCVFTNSTGTTTLTVEGSFDGSTLDSTMTYGAGITASNTPAGAQVVVQHTFVRFRVVQATANATATTIFIQSRA